MTRLTAISSGLLCGISITVLAASTQNVSAQGCVIARGGGGVMVLGGDGLLEPHQWQTALTYRWLRSDRHFRGTTEEKHRQDEGTEVINDSHFLDFTTTYALTKRTWLNLTIPFTYSDRSSLYEHKGNSSGERYHTQAGGLADIRLTSTVWLVDPEEYHAGNLAVGIGVKAPTGDYKARDTFMRPTGPERRYVDSSIQPGDGGWGIVLEAQGFHHIVGGLSGYFNGSYLLNPRDMVEETGYSVPDSYFFRTGVDYAIWPSHGLSMSLGGRIEGVAVHDIIGDENGRRRPGFAISVEPGISYVHGSFAATLTAPIALIRNRQQSVPEKETGRHGDAAFADFTINASVSYRF